MADDLFLLVGGRKIGGWERISVTLRLEAFPNSFEVGLSSIDPVSREIISIEPGDACQVMLGDDLVISGYVDRAGDGGDANGHALRISGRGKTQDLVDCSAEWPSGQLIEGTALDIASKLAKPYGIDVILANGAGAGDKVPGWALNYGETAASIIQRVAQNAALLAYEDPQGRLLLAKVGSKQAASGIVYGQNVESWQTETSMDQRYSTVVCCSIAMAALNDLPGGDFFDTETDPNVPRHRQLDIILEEVAEDAQAFTIRKAKWEIARRAGRATAVEVTIDSWRDAAGTLWLPNTLVPVTLPRLRGPDKALCVSEVTFVRDEGGTHAHLTLMPRAAFDPAPINLLPVNLSDLKGPNE